MITQAGNICSTSPTWSDASSDEETVSISLSTDAKQASKATPRLSTSYCAICEVRLGKQPWRRPHRCMVCMKVVCGEHSIRKEGEGGISRVCQHCQRLEARKKAKEELKIEMMEIKAETTRISADNESLKASIDAFSTQITSKQATNSEIQLNSLARIRPLHESFAQAKASREELSPFLSELHLSIASHSASLAAIHARFTALNSQMKVLCDSIDEERKTVHFLERELRERHKKLRFSVPKEPCPHLRLVSPREERDPLGSLACNLRCLLM